jgi:hypothetical protein
MNGATSAVPHVSVVCAGTAYCTSLQKMLKQIRFIHSVAFSVLKHNPLLHDLNDFIIGSEAASKCIC